MTGILQPLSWTDRQIAVLRALSESDVPLYGVEIGQRAGLDPKTVYTALVPLAAWRYVTEVNPPSQRPLYQRRRYFKATDRGRAALIKRCESDVPRETSEGRSQ